MFGKGSSTSRCDLKENLVNGGCSSSAVEFPTSTQTVLQDDPLSDTGNAADVTQIRPQKLRIKLRPGTDQTNDVMVVSMHVPGLSHLLSQTKQAHRALLDEVASNWIREKCWKNF